MRAWMMACLLGASMAGTAAANEVQVHTASLAVPDPSFGLVSEQATVSTVGVTFARSLVPHLNLDWKVGYEFGARERGSSDAGYYYGDEYGDQQGNTSYISGTVENRLAFHGLEAGVRWSVPVRGWLVPYVSLSGRFYAGHFSQTDNVTGWEMIDPEDPAGEATLYLVERYHDVGFAGGVQGSVGVALMFKPKAKPVALNVRYRYLGGQAGQGTSEVSAPAPAAPAAGLEASSPSVSGPSAEPAPEAAPVPAPEASPAAGEGSLEHTPAPVPAPASEFSPASQPSRTDRGPAIQSRWGWGANLEVGYSLLSDLTFLSSGSLDMGGLRVQGGVLVTF